MCLTKTNFFIYILFSKIESFKALKVSKHLDNIFKDKPRENHRNYAQKSTLKADLP